MVKNKLNPEPIFDKQGNQVGVILKYKEFEALMETLEDLHDIYLAYKRKDGNKKTISLEDVEKELFGHEK